MLPNSQQDCFLEAVANTRHAMYRVALIMLRNPTDAQDAVSDALEATWRRIDKIRNLKALPNYLMRSTINASHKVLRQRKRESSLSDPRLVSPPPP